MKSKTLGFLVSLVIITTVFWVVMMGVTRAAEPVFGNLAARISYLQVHQTVFFLNYLNAGLITSFTVAMMAGFYGFLQRENPVWAAIGFVFLPIYGLANLVSYFSQLVVVPRLLVLFAEPANVAMAEFLLGQTLHDWPGSAVGFVNGLAYAALAIPSIIFGVLFWPHGRAMRAGGLLLAASGFLSLLALFGTVAGSSLLAGASFWSGVVYLVGLVPMANVLLRARPEPGQGFRPRSAGETEPTGVPAI